MIKKPIRWRFRSRTVLKEFTVLTSISSCCSRFHLSMTLSETRRFTRIVPGMKEFDYTLRLEILKLWSLEERMNRSDLIEVFKMYRGFSSIPFETFFQLDRDSRTRGHTAKLKKHRCNIELRRHFFSERIGGTNFGRKQSVQQTSTLLNSISIKNFWQGWTYSGLVRWVLGQLQTVGPTGMNQVWIHVSDGLRRIVIY